MADRLRIESEQALAQLQENHRALECQLAQALRTQEEKDQQLENLRAEHREASRKLAEVTQRRQRERAELEDDVQEGDEAERGKLVGRGVAEGYLRSLAVLEKKKERQKNPRRILKLSEKSW